MSQNIFTGDKKNLNYFLSSFDQKIIRTLLPLVPPWVGTVELTLMTVAWSALAVFLGYLSSLDIRWLLALNVCIFLQHVTDMLDGAVGRMRKEGLVKWGFYMDHFLDYIFLCAVITGYSFLLPAFLDVYVLLWITVSGGFMAHFFLDFAITREFKISYNQFGSSEIRYVLIVFNIILIFTGKQILIQIFPAIPIVLCLILAIVVYNSQKVYRDMDRKELNR